jgi:iron-sulfur cluster repair protein YtfE (RIC family)
MEKDMQQSNFSQQGNAPAARVDIYSGIHKAVRALLCDTLSRVARLDLDDENELAGTLRQVREMLEFCEHHIANEERFVHPAMEARQPGSAAGTAADHEHHEAAVAAMRADCAMLEGQPGTERDAAWRRLQRRLAQFTGDNLLHMDTEETANNAVLQACYSDAELMDLHRQILASLPPEEMAVDLHWILRGSSPAERVRLMAGIRADVPPPVFDGLLELARQSLDAGGWNKLAAALAPMRIAA